MLPAVPPPDVAQLTALHTRLLVLLVRHDAPRLRDLAGSGRRGGVAEWYDELAALVLLREDLFAHILPRIVRRLSFAAPQRTSIAPPPVYAAIDWERSLLRHWQSTLPPDAPPLELYARQRQRDFATPANLLVVVTLLECRIQAQRLASTLPDTLPDLHQFCRTLIVQCEQALAFPQFAAIIPLAQPYLEQGGSLLAPLEAQVAARAQPGYAGAYADLLLWRQQWRGLRLLANPTSHRTVSTPAALDQVYALWLWYELVDLLHQQGGLIATTTSQPSRTLHLAWAGCEYRIQAITPTSFAVQRIVPPPVQVAANGTTYWQEPELIGHAAYTATDKIPFTTLHGMLLERSATDGLLLTAEPPPELPPALPSYRVQVLHCVPTHDGAQAQQQWQHALHSIHTHIGTPPVLRCHGLFLDTLGASAHSAWLPMHLPPDTPPEDILVCPQPHHAPPRIQLVSRQHHCCRDGHICHIIGHAHAYKPVRPPRTPSELLHELEYLLLEADPDTLDDTAIAHLTHQIEQLARHLAELSGATQRITVYYHRLQDLGLAPVFEQLDDAARQSLALALFLVEQLDSVQAHDYSAPIIQIAGVLERLLQQRLLACPDLTGAAFRGLPSLGTLPYMRRNPERTAGDWERLQAYLAQVWQEPLAYAGQVYRLPFDGFVTLIGQVRTIRNCAAHTTPIKRTEYARFFRLVCQSDANHIGVLPAMLLAWAVP